MLSPFALPPKGRLVAIVTTFALAGCVDNFDPALFMGSETGLSGELVDVCGTEAPMLRVPDGAASHEFDIDTRTFSDQFNTAAVACTGRAQNGPDAFLQIDAARGEHWHFHMDVDPAETTLTANPAIYVVPEGCDDRDCQFGDGLDICGIASDEHFTFVPDAPGNYVIAFDSPAEGYGGRVLAIRTVCGDGNRDHSENCDDGNLEDGDGCDAECRTEITGQSPAEVEVNDDVYAANRVMAAGSDVVRVRAELSSLCESDVFAVDVPQGGDVIVSLAGSGGADCPSDLMLADLTLLSVGMQGPTRLATGRTVDEDTCPSIPAETAGATNLAAGVYYVSMQTVRDRPDLEAYEISITVAP